jgi:hypothetical protein
MGPNERCPNCHLQQPTSAGSPNQDRFPPSTQQHVETLQASPSREHRLVEGGSSGFLVGCTRQPILGPGRHEIREPGRLALK